MQIIMVLVTSVVTSTGDTARYYLHLTKEEIAGPQHGKRWKMGVGLYLCW